VLIASSDADGRTDISPKGNAPGFVRVLDERTLVIPERPGNQRFDTLRNLFQSPRVGLIFLIPFASLATRGLACAHGLPTLTETIKDAASIPAPVEVIGGLIKDDEVDRLY
jgi:predicted pyridoxine 5'-phosphate oxidase superfamily flavin-nucleotide-binding protein